MSIANSLQPQSHGLTGTHRVRVFRPSLREASRLCPTVRDWFELRAQVLKLRYWPEREHAFQNGHVLDLNWSWIKALAGKNIGELRIDDTIAGSTNLRAIFYVGDPEVKRPLPLIWLLAVLNKKRDDFTKEQVDIFDGRRTLVLERYYKLREFD